MIVIFVTGPSGVLRMVSIRSRSLGRDGPLVRQRRIELRHAQRLDQPRRLEGRHLPCRGWRRTARGGSSTWPAAGSASPRTRTDRRCCPGRVRCRQPVSARRRNRRGRWKATLALSEGKPRPLIDAWLRRERLDLPAVAVDHVDHLLQRGRRAARPAAADWCTAGASAGNWRR